MPPRTLWLVGLVLAAAAVVGCSTPTTHRAVSEGACDSAESLAKLDDDWSAAARKRNVDLVASFYAHDAIAYPPGEPVAVGQEAARSVWARYFDDPSFSITWKTTHAAVSESGDLGITTGTYQAVYAGADGKPVSEIGKYSCVWKRQPDGSWKAVHDMWNTDSR